MLLGIAILTVYVPGVIGLSSITSWAVMWLVMPILLLKCKIEITIIHVLGLVFLSYASLSLLWSPHGMLELMQLFAIASVFLWAYTLNDLKDITVGLSIGLAVSSILAILQFFGLDFVYHASDAKLTGLFVNSNIYAETSGMLLLLILINKLWWYIPVTIPGLMVSSRAVILGLGASLALLMWAKSKTLSILTLISSWLLAYFITYPSTVAIQSDNMTMSVFQRLYVWQDMLAGLTIFGKGIGSFVFVFPEYNKHLDSMIIAEYAHNDLLQLFFELGIGAIPLIIIVALLLLKANNEYKSALVFFIIIGFFGFPLHMPATSFMLALVAAQLVKSSMGSWDTVYNFRSILSNRMEAIRYS